MDTIGMAAQAEERTGGGRRRRRAWSIEEKQQIIAESLMPGASASVVARRHDVNTNQLFTWRRQLGGGDAASGQEVSFVPATIAAEAPPVAPCSGGNDRIEIVLASGTRIIVGTAVDASALARVVKVLSRQR